MSLPLLGAGLSAPGVAITGLAVDFPFATSQSLTSATDSINFTFTRGTTAYYHNSSGVLTNAAINSPRFEYQYNGTSWVCKGLLLESGGINYCPYSNYPASGWQIYPSGSLNFTSNFATAPDGTTTAARIYPNANGSFPTIYQGTASSSIKTQSVYAKYNGIPYIAFYNSAGSGPAVWFNIQTGTVGTSTGYTANIQNVGNGWYRCSATNDISSSSWAYHYVCLVDANGGTTVTASGTNGALIWGAQSELNTSATYAPRAKFASSYIPTGASSATREVDSCYITGANFTSIFNPVEGTSVLEYSTNPLSLGFPQMYLMGIAMNNGSTDIASQIYASSSSNIMICAMRVASTDYNSNGSSGSFVANSASKIAYGFMSGSMAAYLNGVASGSSSSSYSTATFNTSSSNRMWLGTRNSSSQSLSAFTGYISRFRYYPTRLSNGTLASLST